MIGGMTVEQRLLSRSWHGEIVAILQLETWVGTGHPSGVLSHPGAPLETASRPAEPCRGSTHHGRSTFATARRILRVRSDGGPLLAERTMGMRVSQSVIGQVKEGRMEHAIGMSSEAAS